MLSAWLTRDHKGIGLSLDEALVFWRRAFTGKTDEEFQKSYSYNIRHSYGMEGRRKDYMPQRHVLLQLSAH